LEQFSPNEDGVLMDSPAMKTFLSNYEKFMTTDFLNVQSKKRTNYRQIIRDQVNNLEKTLLHNEEYKCYLYY
jgi:CRISPR/Cas system-associated endonuclease Cas1